MRFELVDSEAANTLGLVLEKMETRVPPSQTMNTRVRKKNPKSFRFGKLPLFEPRRLDFLRRLRERNAQPPFKKNWLEPIWHRLMHNRTVPVALDVLIKTLRRFTPRDLASAVARHRPLNEASEVLLESLKIL